MKQHVATSWTGVYFFQQISSTCNNKFCCVTMFEVGGNTANNAFQLAMQQCYVASCSNLLLVLLHLYSQSENPFMLGKSLPQAIEQSRLWDKIESGKSNLGSEQSSKQEQQRYRDKLHWNSKTCCAAFDFRQNLGLNYLELCLHIHVFRYFSCSVQFCLWQSFSSRLQFTAINVSFSLSGVEHVVRHFGQFLKILFFLKLRLCKLLETKKDCY